MSTPFRPTSRITCGPRPTQSIRIVSCGRSSGCVKLLTNSWQAPSTILTTKTWRKRLSLRSCQCLNCFAMSLTSTKTAASASSRHPETSPLLARRCELSKKNDGMESAYRFLESSLSSGEPKHQIVFCRNQSSSARQSQTALLTHSTTHCQRDRDPLRLHQRILHINRSRSTRIQRLALPKADLGRMSGIRRSNLIPALP